MSFRRLLSLLILSVCGASLARAEELKLTACSYEARFLDTLMPKMGPPTPAMGELDQFLLDAFLRLYGSKVPAIPLLTLESEPNARVGPFGIALNRAWMNGQGEPMATGILAHQLGHLCHAYKLMPITDDCKAYGAEGEVEYYAGRLLAASGMTEEMFEGAIAPIISRYPESKTMPAGNIRVMLMRAGFYYDK